MTSPVWKVFDKPIDSSQKVVGCPLYRRQLRYNNSTSNIIAHLKNMHPDEYAKKTKAARRSSLFEEKPNLKRIHQENENEPTNQSTDECLANFICTSASSFRIVENLEFQSFVRTLSSQYALPSANTLRRYIDTENEKYTNDMKKHFKNFKSFVLVTDGFSDRKHDHSFYSVHLLFVNENYEREMHLIGVETVSGPGTSINISNALIALLERVNLKLSDCMAVISDGARVLQCLSQTHNLLNLHCSCHVINLVFEEYGQIPCIKRILDKTKKVAAYIRSHKSERDEMKKTASLLKTTEPLPLPLSPTRWASIFLLFKNYYANITAFGSFSGLQSYLLTPPELNITQESLTILRPLYITMRRLEKDESFGSEIIPCMLSNLDEIQQTQSPLARKLAKIDVYLENDFILMQLLLDPRFAYVPNLTGNKSWKDAEISVSEFFSTDIPTTPSSNTVIQSKELGVENFLRKQLGNSCDHATTLEVS
uniref:BED-type domain-containing protein n=1 Tax=Caenorhabditis japonica TaxID=281687 RepID=A0A8R1HMS1_CAEJA